MFYPGDEVCKIRNGHLAFGVVSQKVSSGRDGDSEKWKVDWNDGLGYEEDTSSLTLSDRPIHIGCKVKRASPEESDLVGICRNTTLVVDLRLVGTNTILSSRPISTFTHLKEFRQKSVVYLNGWLGVIISTQRSANVVRSNNDTTWVPYSELPNPTTKFVNIIDVEPILISDESPWVNELLGSSVRQPSRPPHTAPSIPIRRPLLNKTTPTCADAKYLQDLKVVKVKVAWRYQIDLMCPDHPPEVVTGSKLSKLRLVTYETGSSAFFQPGNLGRYTLRSTDEIVSYKDYEQNFVKKYLSDESNKFNAKLLEPDEPYSERAYLINPEAVLLMEQTHVVEIVHCSTTADVMWQNGTMDFARSVDVVNVIDERMIISVLNPMDFITSPNRIKSDEYGVVQRTDLEEKTLAVKVLTTTSPPIVTANTLVLKDSEVAPHPRYRYFNETNSIVVVHNEEKLRIGHVQRLNFSGKIQVCWIDTKKEEWCWPTECSLYIVRGFDLECIISLTNEDDEVSSCPAVKFSKDLAKLAKIKQIWHDVENQDDRTLAQSLENLKFAVDACVTAEKFAGLGKDTCIVTGSYSETTTKLSTLSADASDGEMDYRKPYFVRLMQGYCDYLHGAATHLFHYLRSQYASESIIKGSVPNDAISCSSDRFDHVLPMDVDKPSSDSTNLHSSTKVMLPKVFDTSVKMLDDHPSSHSYAKKALESSQYQVLLQTIRREMTNFHRSDAPGIKVLTYADRLDLLSILICGPFQTPYEDTLCLFDAMLPGKYPTVPPKLNFLPYGAGRLNPNLYDCGKVCLSLLGTWQGRDQREGWTKDSNLLQVLISVQALILVNEPYHNEPGHDAENYTPDVRKKYRREYNTQLMPKICEMMLTQVQNPGKPWDDDIRTFYLERIPRFVARWRKWFDIGNQTANEAEFMAELSEDDKPGFEIYPFSTELKSAMEERLRKLEAAHKILMEPDPQPKQHKPE